MKKIIITTLALACGLGAYAKTLAELKAEMPAYQDNDTVRAARRAYMAENKTDFVREFDAWKSTNAAKFFLGEPQNAALTDEQKKLAVENRAFFRAVYWVLSRELDVPANTALRLVPQVYFAENPTAWDKIKADGYKVDGVAMPETLITGCAFAARDEAWLFANADRLAAIPLAGLVSFAEDTRKMLLRSSDFAAAKKFCTAYECEMLVKGADADNAALVKIKTVGKYLTERLLDAKIAK